MHATQEMARRATSPRNRFHPTTASPRRSASGFPMAGGAVAAVAPVHELSSDVMSVVVIDDQVMLAETLSHRIDAETDMTVVASGNRRHGVRLVERTRPAIAVVAHGPGGDGLGIVVQIRQASPDTVCVLLADNEAGAPVLEAVEAGCVGVIGKDQSSERMIRALRAASRGQSLLTPDQLMRLIPRAPEPAAGADLTAREREILARVAEGRTARQIGGDLHISVHTVRNYVQSALGKLNVHSKLEAVMVAAQLGIITLPVN